MGTARIRKSEGLGGLRFRRNLAIDWEVEQALSAETIIGDGGDLIHAIVFGDPYSSDAKGPISLLEIPFMYFKSSAVSLETSAGNKHKIVDGPFFKSKVSDQSDNFKSLISLGAWSTNLPADCHLDLVVKNLVPDNVYQIRCVFIDGKNKVSPRLFLGPGNHEINYDRGQGVVAVGTFIAPDASVNIRIASGSTEPPHINAVVLRQTGYSPRTTITGLRTIYGSKR